MRNSIKLMVVVSIVLGATQIYADNNDWGNIHRYASLNRELALPAKGEHRVVFMGNSITEGWVNIHPEFFNDNNYIGRGISGQTSPQMLLRFREDVINLHPDIVVINAGTNDCAENTGPFNIDVTFGNIVSMVELAKANGIKVMIASVLPAAEFAWNKNVTDAAIRISSLNEKLKDYATENNIPYVDYYSQLVYGDDRALNPAYTNDGVHPTADGYTVMEAIVGPAIKNALTKK